MEVNPAPKSAPSAIVVDRQPVIVSGKWLRLAEVADEEWMEQAPVTEPEKFVSELRKSGVQADVFTFSQNLLETEPKHQINFEWDNLAVIPISTYAAWSEKLSQDTRRNVRLASKRGAILRPAVFDDDFVRGIVEIYNETPIRQGRKFWHYGKSFETVKAENGTYADRSQFIGAYVGTELIGFLKMVYVGKAANIMQILSKVAHQDKKPMNALVAKAVEICSEKGICSLIYRKYCYHKNRADALTEFKRRNGFEQVLVPRYYVPLTAKGSLALKLRLHHGVKELMPRRVMDFLIDFRRKVTESRNRRPAGSPVG
jgi:hypothetical protein